ncbi:hypothetical protein AgCh_024388 [Apium graveolens]
MASKTTTTSFDDLPQEMAASILLRLPVKALIRSADDYRVVRIVYCVDSKYSFFGDVAPKVEVYSLRKQTWKKIKDPVVPRLAFNEGIYVNGSFYWLEQFVNQEENDLWILSFDFENEKNSIISWSLRFRAIIKEDGSPIDITKRGTILIETCPLLGHLDIRGVVAGFALKVMPTLLDATCIRSFKSVSF